jgi:hypothetical protein
MSDAFYVEDQGSTLLLEGVIIERNQIQGEPWSAIAARTNSIVQISETTIADNTGVEFGVVAFAAMITIQDSFVRQNTGSVSYELRFKRCKTMVDTISHFLKSVLLLGIYGYAECTRFCNHRCSDNYEPSGS